MSVLYKISCMQDRRDEVPNQELAKELSESENREGIKEIVENLFNKDSKIKSDCIKVLYEVGYIKPELIAEYAEIFIRLLKSRSNRMVWGAMMALAVIADMKADVIFENIDGIYAAMKEGSVITVDNGIKVLAGTALKSEEYNKLIFPYLINHLRTCRPKEVGQHAESTLKAVNAQNRDEFIAVLRGREDQLSKPQLARVKKLYKALGIF